MSVLGASCNQCRVDVDSEAESERWGSLVLAFSTQLVSRVCDSLFSRVEAESGEYSRLHEIQLILFSLLSFSPGSRARKAVVAARGRAFSQHL